MISSGPISGGKVKKELLTDVAKNCHYRVNNKLDKELKPRPVREILRSANERLGEKPGYNVLWKNCEHFVTELRYGDARSLQVRPSLGWSLSLLEVCFGWGDQAVHPEGIVTLNMQRWALEALQAGRQHNLEQF